jgi:hypothetical protein
MLCRTSQFEIMLSVVMLIVIILSAIMIPVIVESVNRLNVVAPVRETCEIKEKRLGQGLYSRALQVVKLSLQFEVIS